MPTWCMGIHGSNPRNLNTLAMPFYSVIPLTRIPSPRLVAKLLKMERETGPEPVCYQFRLLQIIARRLFTSQIARAVAVCFSLSRRESSKNLAQTASKRVAMRIR